MAALTEQAAGIRAAVGNATIASLRAELEELRNLVTNLTLASVVLTEKDRGMQAQVTSGNVVPIRSPAHQEEVQER